MGTLRTPGPIRCPKKRGNDANKVGKKFENATRRLSLEVLQAQPWKGEQKRGVVEKLKQTRVKKTKENKKTPRYE